MKTTYVTILVLAMMVVLLTAPVPCGAAEKDRENIWSDEKPKPVAKQRQLTKETIKRIMSRLAETNPEKAEELEQLRKKDPEKFKLELRKIVRGQFSKRIRERGKERPGQRRGAPEAMARPGGGPSRGGMPGMPGMGMHPGMRGRAMEMRKKHAEYLEWLKENYPKEVEKLAELREEKPELYMRRLGLNLKKYGRIAEAEKENPELAKVLKEDLELKEKRNKLLRKIRASTNDAEKKRLTKELEEVVSSKFDLIVKRKQIEYEQLSKKLEKLKEQVKRSEAEVEKWENVKDKEVKQRLEELISRAEKFNWE